MSAEELAGRWFDEVRAGDMRAAWAMMTANFRTCVAQAVMSTMHERGHSVDALLRRFERAKVDVTAEGEDFLAAARATLLEHVAPNLLSGDVLPGTRPRPLSPGLELVPLIATDDAERTPDGGFEIPAGGTARAARVLVEDGREVAGLDYLLEPGWPPTVAYQPPADE